MQILKFYVEMMIEYWFFFYKWYFCDEVLVADTISCSDDLILVGISVRLSFDSV